MRTPAHDTALYLAAQGVTGALGGATGWPVCTGREPLEPADVVTVYDTGGGAPTGKSGPQLRYPTIQVRVRSDDYVSGWEKADEIQRALFDTTSEATQGGVNVQWVAQGDVNYIGRDDKDRPLFTANYRMTRQPT